MIKDIKQLVELCELNKQIDAYAPQIAEISVALAHKKDAIDSAKRRGEKIAKEIADLRENIASTNAKIAEFHAKITDVSHKTGAVKTEREASALLTEEEVAKDQLTSANEDIARYERMIETKEEALAENEAAQNAAQAEFDELERSSADVLSDIEKGRKLLTKRKDELVAECDQKLVVFYEKIRKWAKNTAVVPVRKQACYGCFMKINDKTYANVLRGDEVVTCPHCGRIIYKEI